MEVILPPQAVAILTKRRKERTGSGFVFPSYGKTGHIVDPRKAWAALCKRAGVEDCRIHDLRRTLGSWQAASGSSLLVVGKSLGHRTPEATQVYARLNLDPVRESVTKAVDAMLATKEPKTCKRKAKKGGKVA
jgi:integrase